MPVEALVLVVVSDWPVAVPDVPVPVVVPVLVDAVVSVWPLVAPVPVVVSVPVEAVVPAWPPVVAVPVLPLMVELVPVLVPVPVCHSGR